MKKCIIILIFFLNSICPGWTQESASAEYSIAIVELIGIKSTGKRHNSHFFTFRIKKLLSGEIKDSVFTSQEIYNDFGARQILSKLNLKNYCFQHKTEKAKDIIVKFSYIDSQEDNKRTYAIMWVAEKHRQNSLEGLEEFLESYFSKKKKSKIDKNLLLHEQDGKLFFSDGEKRSKIAVEVYLGSGDWIIAIIENRDD